MKIEVKHRNQNLFPRLRIHYTNIIVLFTSEKEGTIIRGNAVEKTGTHYKKWDSSSFTDFNGSITLSNGD